MKQPNKRMRAELERAIAQQTTPAPAPEPEPEPDQEDEDAARDIVDRYLKACGGERMGFVVGAAEQDLIVDIAIALMHARGRNEP